MPDLLGHAEDFIFYPKCNGESIKSCFFLNEVIYISYVCYI